MTRQLKAKKFAKTKRLINPKNQKCKPAKKIEQKAITPNSALQHTIPQEPSQLFFHFNPALGPPYRLLLDTNFLNLSYQNKLDIFKSSMDCLLGKCIPIVTECVIAEMEKLGTRSRLALKLVKDPRFIKVKCQHKGTYADDCIVNRVTQHRCFIVCTCDKDLKRRIRKIAGVPIMYISAHKYTIERMPEAFGAPK